MHGTGVGMRRACGLFGLGVASVLGVAACGGGGGGAGQVGAISSVTYTQNAAIPNYDSSPHTVTSPARLAALRTVLQHDGWKPKPTTNEVVKDGCSGGTSTMLKITFATGTHSTISVAPCGSDADALSNDITALVNRWHTNKLAPEPSPPPTTKR